MAECLSGVCEALGLQNQTHKKHHQPADRPTNQQQKPIKAKPIFKNGQNFFEYTLQKKICESQVSSDMYSTLLLIGEI